MDFKPKNTKVSSTASVEGVMDENLDTVVLEVVDPLTMTDTLFFNTEASQAILSNMDCTVSVEDKK